MNGRRFGNLGAALLVAGALGLAGYGGSVQAQPAAADCQDPAMMGDQKMGDPAMMGDQKMGDPSMMGDQKMGDPAMMGDSGMMGDPMMDDKAMMGNRSLRARDGQCLASQSTAIQSAFVAVFGDGAGARWVQEHEAALTRSGM